MEYMFITLAEQGISDSQTTSDDFRYIACEWRDSRCIQRDTGNFTSNGDSLSVWPSGPYVLLTPNEGCPESSAKGWRHGYISLTWKQRHTLMSTSVCDVFEQSVWEAEMEGIKQPDTENCFYNMTNDNWRIVTREMWPEIQTALLGPFSDYSMRINFCFKTRDETYAEDGETWPEGSYSIFGANHTCPPGFTSSERDIKFPDISAWTSYGFLPDFAIKKRVEDKFTLLTLRSCDHHTDNIESQYATNQSLPFQDTFVLMKRDHNYSCPQFQDTDLTVEALGLREAAAEKGEIQDLFTVCYYRTKEGFIDSDPHLYDPQNSIPLYAKTAYVVLNPSLIHGNGRTRSGRSNILRKSGAQLPNVIGHQWETVPWLLVDLGRHMQVVGVQFTKFYLTELDGKEYRGTKNTSIDGYPCQRWDSQYPHSHGMVGNDQFPDRTVSDAENYCRDPSGDDILWCYLQDPLYRWDKCTSRVYKFQEDDRPFSKCLISDDRWRMDEFGALSCRYTVSYDSGILYYSFLKELGGRYVKLVGYAGTDGSTFNHLIQNVQVLTAAKITYEGFCGSDLGMGDESVQDFHITASSWLPQFLPSFGRPFFPGWCSSALENNPYITVDMKQNTKIDGITVFNWERTEEDIHSGIYKKIFIPVGSKKIMVSYSTDLNIGKPWAYENKLVQQQYNLEATLRNTGSSSILGLYIAYLREKICFLASPDTAFDSYVVSAPQTFSMDMYLPLEQPQTFLHNPVVARYVTVYIIESMTANAKCLRFELHGCKQAGASDIGLPPLLANSWVLSASGKYDELITFDNVHKLNNTSVLSSIGYPKHYPLGVSYTWIIDMQERRFIQLIFANVSLNKYEIQAWGQCSDSLKFLPRSYHDDTIVIDQRFNGLLFMVETDLPYLALAFTTCRATSKIQSVGNGFKALVTALEVPTCFTLKGSKHNKIQNNCMRPMMHLTSIARQNFPDSRVPEEWVINVARFFVQLEILYCNVRCDTGSVFRISDRFSGGKTYCNLRTVPPKIYSDSDTLFIRFEKDQSGIEATSRLSAREGFKAVYRTFQKSMTHLVDSHKTTAQALLKLAELEIYWDQHWKNATLLTYKACSKRFGKCYAIYSGALTSWATAGAECWIRQMRLVSIHSDEEHELVKYILRNFRYFDFGPRTLQNAFSSDDIDPNYFTHIGLSRVTSKTGRHLHVWEDGSPVTFSAWKAGEPSLEKDCTRMSFHLLNTNNTWEAEHCEKGSTSYFICEQPLTPELLNIAESATFLYTGTLNMTLSGLPCQRWDWQYPHQHRYYRDEQFPDKSVSAAENYCRDPDFSGSLWCYTEDWKVRWEKCWVEETDAFVPSLYDGFLSKTTSGRTCQRWDKQYPHAHLSTLITYFPDDSLDMAANHCRDPTNEGILWCYTTDPNQRWETCNFKDTGSDRCHLTHSQYTGQWNTTQSGKTCQPWASHTPHDHEPFEDSQFPDRTVVEASNFCRDPYGDGYLWCFTMDPATKTEPCFFNYKYSIEDETFKAAFLNSTFECSNGENISQQYVCNGIPNCLDVSDEVNCTKIVHALMKTRKIPTEIQNNNDTFLSFQCNNKEWISLLARCDGVVDCSDATDELNCSLHAEYECSTEEYTCDDGECIHLSQMCDFIEDCRDASDENCDFPLCSSTEYRCRNQQCIPIENRCDAFENCLDGTDETGCDVCRENTFHCDFVRCIPQRLVCDKYPDCEDGSDEMSCDQPKHNSCEEWWAAGYRRSGMYKLDNSDSGVECNFDEIPNDGHIYTLFHNFEISARYGVEVIHSADNEATEESNHIINRFFKNDSYTCTHNITQSCIPAYKAAADNENLDQTEAYRHCDCLVLMMNPGRHDINSSKVVECEGGKEVTDMGRLFFSYREYKSKRNITLKEDFPKGVEVTLGPAVCKHVNANVESDVGCEDENIFPASVRCVYDTDNGGYILGCRSGQHLQDCELFECPANTVKCPGSFCLPLKFICDGIRHCPGAEDEESCGCKDADREILLMYEERNNFEEQNELRKIASQFYSTNSVVRELRYQLSYDLDDDHRILDISDVEINPYSTIDRQFVCNYSLLASDFINRIEFTKKNTTAVIFVQKRNDSDNLPKMIFGNLKSRPTFLLYRLIEETYSTANEIETFPFVHNVFVKRITILKTTAAKFFPDLCTAAATVYCPQGFRCAASETCIPLEQVCDGHRQCLHGDDERLCNYSCQESCECAEYTTDCSFAGIQNSTLANIDKKSRRIILSGNPGLKKSLTAQIWQFPYLVSLNLSNCDIQEIDANVFQSLVNLRILDLSFNRFSKVPSYAFVGLQRLKILNLFGNREIYSLEPFSLTGLSSLDRFEIKGAYISKLSKQAFFGLKLGQLVFSNNTITDMEDGVFAGLNVKFIDIEKNAIANFDKGLFQGVSGITTLHAPAFKYCCVRPNYLGEENCFPEKDEFSSCDDLLRLSALQTMLWLIGLIALFGNILSVVYRLVYDRERLKMGYGIFVTNLAVADFLMGIYLIIIAIADAIFRKRYIFIDDFWRNSAWCTVAGFLSTVSSEASVFFLCLITLDRLFVIKYPFGQVRFDTKKSGIACLFSWIIAISIGLIPILHTDYFHDVFYSKSGVCIALPLTKDQPPGWLYSIVIFVGLNFVTFCLIAIGQIVIYLEIRKASAGIRHFSSRKGRSGAGRRRELAVARNLLLVVSTDFMCWFPIGCMGIMSLSGHVIPGDVYAWTAVFILPINSALNPVLYTLTAIIGKKKSETQMDKSISSVRTQYSYKRVQPFNGLFRYFMTRKDSPGQTFVSLNDVLKENIAITTTDILKISLHLTRSLRLLHKNSLVLTTLDGSVVYTNIQYGKITGDIQLRQEPTVCCSNEQKAEDMQMFGQVVRCLLAKRNKQMIAKK